MNPHEGYRQDLLAAIESLDPRSLLDVGCGDGGLLREMLDRGRTCVGVEIEEEHVNTLKESGFEAMLCRADHLGVPDRSFDVVVFEYSLHHVDNIERALLEAARVARRAVLVLDPWFDLSIPSQRIAHEFDLWLKTLDRRVGMIHWPSVSAEQLAKPFRVLGSFRIDCRYRLTPLAISLERMLEHARDQLAKVRNPFERELALEAIVDRARLDGISEDGAILFSAVRAGDL